MKSLFKPTFVVTITVGALAVSAPAALAAPPTNDTFAGATPVAVGFTEVLDTSDATTDGDDAQVNASCGAPATDASVWYVIEGTDQGVVVDVSQSDYPAGVLVGVGTQGNLETIACGPGTTVFTAVAGTTYYVLAFDDQTDGSGNGGSLNISFVEAPPPPTIDIALNRFGRVNIHTGVATVTGTYTCTNGEFLDININADQKIGRGSVFGFGGLFEQGTCDGEPRAWTIDLNPQNGRFAGGKTVALTFTFSCGPGGLECTDGFFEQTVQLRGGGQSKGKPGVRRGNSKQPK